MSISANGIARGTGARYVRRAPLLKEGCVYKQCTLKKSHTLQLVAESHQGSVFPLSCARVRAHTAFRDCAHAQIYCAQTYDEAMFSAGKLRKIRFVDLLKGRISSQNVPCSGVVPLGPGEGGGPHQFSEMCYFLQFKK